MRINVYILEDFHGEKYLQTNVRLSRNPTPPMDRAKDVQWHLN
jgi:hypothetical protein